MWSSIISCCVAAGCALLLAGQTPKADQTAGVALFNGKDLAGWKMTDEHSAATWKCVSQARLDIKNNKLLAGSGAGGAAEAILLRLNVEQGGDLQSERSFGDCRLQIEFMVPKESNSGIFFNGQYELQVFDSFGIAENKITEGDCGGIMWTSKPLVNACKAPGQWQTYDVVFRAPRFDASGKKTENARFVSVVLNGRKVQENTEVKEPTGGGLDGEERPRGPIILQGDHGQVAFRNIRVVAVDETVPVK
jgi:hypothetical protein